MRGLLRRLWAGRASVSGDGPASGEGDASVERWLVVGLGNPGPTYAGNRHNVGFMVADLLAERAGARWKSHKTHAEVTETRVAGVPTVLAKPRSYMNRSGGPVAGLSGYYTVPLERVVVIHDDLDIDFGVVKLKRGGGTGGHNGLRSLNASMSRPDYVRVRFGVGRPPGRMDAATHVLKDFSATERRELALNLERAADAAETVLTDGLEKAQHVYHTTQ